MEGSDGRTIRTARWVPEGGGGDYKGCVGQRGEWGRPTEWAARCELAVVLLLQLPLHAEN